MKHHGATWLILGSGPRAAADYPIAKPHADVVATCNGGISIEQTPSFIWLTDTVAVDIYYYPIAHAVTKGAALLTTTRTVQRRPNVAHLAAEIFNYDLTIQKQWIPGKLVNGRTSGCFLTQYAVNHGARKVLLIGMSGYRSGKEGLKKDYFSGRPGGAHNDETMAFYGPMMQSIFDQSPDVEFEMWGAPVYPWKADNLKITLPDTPIVEVDDPWLRHYHARPAAMISKRKLSGSRTRIVEHCTLCPNCGWSTQQGGVV